MKLRVLAYKTQSAYERLIPWVMLIGFPVLFGYGLAEWVAQ